jgi:hypothetical protein
MKKLYTFVIFTACLSFLVNAQTLLTEDFSSGVPPTGWSIDDHVENWLQESSTNAGGTSPEAAFHWDPQFNGESHLISPVIDASSYSVLAFKFRHMIDHYGGPYTIGVATRSAGGDWNTVWEIVNPTASVNAEEVAVIISNSDVGQVDFEISFFFEGDSYNINDWYIDDVELFVPFDHDVATMKILGDTYFDAGDDYEASATIKNLGGNDETFDVILEITNGSTNNVLFTETKNMTLMIGEESDLTFSSFTLPDPNLVYGVSVTTGLASDMDNTNDMKSKYIYTYTSEREMVLLEIGTGTWCVFCPGAAMGADDLIANGQNVAVMEHHSGDDYENVASGARVDYYSITGFPTAVFDGTISYVGGNANSSIYTSYLPIYEQREEVRTAFSLNLYGENTGGGDYTVTATIDKLAPAMFENVVLHIGLTESEIPETWFVMDHLNFVTRLMLPDHEGTAVDIVNEDYIEVEESFTIDPEWDVSHCELTYFLQDVDTKEILQGGKVMVNDLIPVGVDETLNEQGVTIHNIYPNPMTDQTNISFSLAEGGDVNVSVHDMTGRQIATVNQAKMTAGDHILDWEAGDDIPNGLYFCTIVSNEFKVTQKLMLAR